MIKNNFGATNVPIEHCLQYFCLFFTVDFMGGDAKSPQHTAVHPMYVSYTSIPTSVSANSTANNRNHKAIHNNNTIEPLHTGGGDNGGTLVLHKNNPSVCNSSTNTLLPPYKKSQSQVHLHEPSVMVAAAAAAAAAAAHHNNSNNQSNNAINQMLRNQSTSSFTNRSFAQDVNLNSSFDDFGAEGSNTRRYLIAQQPRNFGINNPFIEHFHRENASYNSDFDSATESAHELSPFLENQTQAPRLPARPDPNTHNFRHNQVNPMPPVHQNGGDYLPEEVTGDGNVRRYYEPRNAGVHNNFKNANGDDNNQRYIMPFHYVTRSPNLSRSSRRRYEQHGRPQHYQPQHQQQQPTGNFFDQIRDAPPGYDEQIMMMHRAKSQDRLTHRSRRSSNNRNRDSQRPRSFCSNLPPYVHE
jgi:sodium/potassium-transporting ATPase subunit beta-1-interacting protein